MDTQEKFRDSIGTVDEEGKRKWVFPKKPSGKLYKYRKWVSYFLLVFLIASPFLKVNGNQFLLFNVIERKFNIFGFPFWPQDFYLFVISMIIVVLFIALFYGGFRENILWMDMSANYFLEMVFRRIEYAIEGNRAKQMRLAAMAWTTEKITKRLLKWSIFFVISFLIANVFLAYLIGGDLVLDYITGDPSEHVSTLISLLIFTGIFYFIFAWFREQVCIIACPYGRLQGALLDNKSIIVAYDHKRGERENGRQKFKKEENREALGIGDCIDCSQCVNVCPTGIDIRNGTQLECINCTACIDECDSIMGKVDLPKGLIRFASEDEIEKKEKFKFTPRMKGYAAVLFILVGLLVGMLFLRNDVQANILRLPGQLYERVDNNFISNVFTFKILNKTNKDIENVELKLLSHEGKIKLVGHENLFIPAQGMAKGTLFLQIKASALNGDKNKVKIGVYRNNKRIETATTNFLGPRSY